MWGVLAHPPSPSQHNTHTHVFTVVCLVNKTEAFSSSGSFTEVSRVTVFVLGLDPAPTPVICDTGKNLNVVISENILEGFLGYLLVSF